jgi:signal transduction histidine kinase
VPTSSTELTTVPSFLRSSRLAGAGAIGSTAIGVLVLIGWAFDVERLRTILPAQIVMLPNTAVAFALGGTSLWLARSADTSPVARRASRTIAAIVLVLGAIWVTERLTGWNAGIDTILFGAKLERYPYRPLGLMATNSTVCIALAGAALLMLDVETRRRHRPSQILAIAGLAIATLGLVGHMYGAPALYQQPIDRAAGMAVITAITIATLNVGILFARADRGDLALLTGPDLGGVLARRLLPAAILVPLILGWLWIRGREELLFSRESGMALLSIVTIAVLMTLVLGSARVLRDIDRDRQAVLEREEAATQAARNALATAETASRAKSDFLAVMSHELRTPLNAIIGYASLLSDGVTGAVSNPQRTQLARIKASAAHLVGLIDEILTLSRIEAGREEMRPEVVPIIRLLDEAGAMAVPLAEAKGLAFRIDAPADSVVIETDCGRTRQVLVNLLSNALKFTDAGEITMAAVADDGEVCFSIRDTGIGIAPEHLDRIFDEFWQVEQATTRRVGGSGLGLSVSRRLARLLGGELTVESEVARGSTFILRLPKRWMASDPIATAPRL